jgi:hypothetical protein
MECVNLWSMPMILLGEDINKKLRGLSPQVKHAERPPLVGEVSANFSR